MRADPAQMLKERAGIIKTRLQAEIGDIRLEPRRRNGRKRGDGGIIGTRRTLVTSQTGRAPFRKAALSHGRERQIYTGREPSGKSYDACVQIIEPLEGKARADQIEPDMFGKAEIGRASCREEGCQ